MKTPEAINAIDRFIGCKTSRDHCMDYDTCENCPFQWQDDEVITALKKAKKALQEAGQHKRVFLLDNETISDLHEFSRKVTCNECKYSKPCKEMHAQKEVYFCQMMEQIVEAHEAE